MAAALSNCGDPGNPTWRNGPMTRTRYAQGRSKCRTRLCPGPRSTTIVIMANTALSVETTIVSQQPRRTVRLDTILRLRWLAVLGQLAAIFVVAHGLEFDLPAVPCLVIVGLSALLNLALLIAFNPM